jgi:hypothetical protein
MLPILYDANSWSQGTAKDVARILRECMHSPSTDDGEEEDNFRKCVLPALQFQLYNVRPEALDVSKTVFNFIQKPITGYSRALRSN